MDTWKEKDNCLEKAFKFKDFREAMAFMLAVSYYCEEAGHHPNWTNEYNKVSVKLSTHDAGNVVTDKDYSLAEKMDIVYQSKFS